MISKVLTYVLVALLIIAIALFVFIRLSTPIVNSSVVFTLPLSTENVSSVLGGDWTINNNYTLTFQHLKNDKYVVIYLNTTGFNTTNYSLPTIGFDSQYIAIYPLLSTMISFANNGTLETLFNNQSDVLAIAIMYFSSSASLFAKQLSLSNVTVNGTYESFNYIYSNNTYELTSQNLYYQIVYPESEIVLVHENEVIVIITSGFTLSPHQLLQIFSKSSFQREIIKVKILSES
ncbi:hypothetical protein SJAV_27390 [Sulfurisphaera javensis]|uniref:Uncharacterized protein n=1 Tax=Sulfurisphaera javensis TaxID=2049879 RepID=A0AAT9GV71_9CREN